MRRFPKCFRTFAIGCSLALTTCQALGQAPGRSQFATSSHRKLALPEGVTSDVNRQIDLIRHLQSLINNRPDANSETGDGLSSFQKSMMESAMRRMISSGNVPNLGDLPKGLISRVMSNPKARQDAKELLQKFHREGILPQGDRAANGLPFPPRDSTTPSGAKLKRRDSTSGRSGTQAAPRSPGEPETVPDSSGRDRRIPDGASTRQDSNMPLPGNSDSPSAPPVRQDGESRSSFNNRLMDYIEKNFEEREGANPTPDPAPPNPKGRPDLQNGPQQSTERSISNGGRRNPITSNSAGTGRQANRGSGNDRTNRDSVERQAPISISDLLKDLDDLPQLTPPESRRTQDGKPRSGRKPDQGTGNSNANRGLSLMDSAELTKQKEEIAKSIDQDSLRSTLRKISSVARQTAKRSRKRSTESNATESEAGEASAGLAEKISSSVVQSLDGLFQGAKRRAGDSKTKQGSEQAGNKGNKPQPAQDASKRTGETDRSSGNGWIQGAGEFINGIVKSEPESASSVTAGSADVGLPGVSGGTILEMLLILSVLGGLLFWALSRASEPVGSNGHAVQLSAREIGRIRTREDVVKAFNKLALAPRHAAQPWWHHQRVRTDIRSKRPAVEGQIELLVSVYEQARYLPDVELDESQIEAARDAFRRCNS